MVAITANDIGNYTCSLPGELATIASATVRLHIVSDLPEPVINRSERPGPTWWTLGVVLLSFLASIDFHCNIFR
jgi:hypothetical protein